jgi:hypothetical protein
MDKLEIHETASLVRYGIRECLLEVWRGAATWVLTCVGYRA